MLVFGGQVTLAAGQAGQQVAGPEEVVTVPAAGLVGGIVGGVVGYFSGEYVSKTVYDYLFSEGVQAGARQ